MQSAKTHIEQIIKNYIRLYPEEYAAVVKGVKMMRDLARDEFSTLEGTNYTRALYELPEELHNMFIIGLTEEEMVWLKAGGADHKQGGHWFARKFPQFALAEKI